MNSIFRAFASTETPRQKENQTSSRVHVKPIAILEVVRRRGRSWGLLAQYEEGRLGLRR
jgi:hypothetical protein